MAHWGESGVTPDHRDDNPFADPSNAEMAKRRQPWTEESPSDPTAKNAEPTES